MSEKDLPYAGSDVENTHRSGSSIHHLMRQVFGHFQNLNLLILREDLRTRRIAQRNWMDSGYLCPLAHGMQNGNTICALVHFTQVESNKQAYCCAASSLCASLFDVQTFADFWDQGIIKSTWLCHQLDLLWHERLDDAVTVQEIIGESSLSVEETSFVRDRRMTSATLEHAM